MEANLISHGGSVAPSSTSPLEPLATTQVYTITLCATFPEFKIFDIF